MQESTQGSPCGTYQGFPESQSTSPTTTGLAPGGGVPPPPEQYRCRSRSTWSMRLKPFFKSQSKQFVGGDLGRLQYSPFAGLGSRPSGSETRTGELKAYK